MPKHVNRPLRHLSRNGLSTAVASVARYAKSRTSTKRKLDFIAKLKSKQRKRIPSRVKTRVSEAKMAADDLHSGVTADICNVVVNSKKHATIGALKTLHCTYPGYARPSTTNGQSSGITFAIGTFDQWNTNIAIGSVLVPSQTYKRWFDLNTNQRGTGSNLFGSTALNRAAQDKFLLLSTDYVLNLWNNDTVPVDCELTFFRSQTDNAKDVQDVWIDSFVAEGEGIGVSATAPAAGTHVSGAFGYESVDFPYARPQDSPYVKKLHKVVKQMKFVLAPAGQKIIKGHITMNMLGDLSKMLENPVKYPRGSLAVHLRIVGGLVADVTGAPALPFPVYATHKVDVIANLKHHFKQVKGSIDRMPMTVGFTQVPQNVTAANSNIINIVDGIVAEILGS